MTGKKFFLTVKGGRFSEKPEGSYNVFDTIKGHLVNITFKQIDAGELMRLHIIDEQNFYMLSVFTNSRAAHGFYMLMKNLKLEKPIDFRIAQKDGRDVLWAEQEGRKVKWAFGNDRDQVQLPPMEQRLSYLKNLATTLVAPLARRSNPYIHHPVYIKPDLINAV